MTAPFAYAEADSELVSAMWCQDPEAIAAALAKGANPNGRDHENYPYWNALLRRGGTAKADTLVRALTQLIAAGLTLNGGGSLVKTKETMLMRLEELDPRLADTLADAVGARRLRYRLARPSQTENLNPSFWSARLARLDALDQQKMLDRRTPVAPVSTPSARGPRL